MKIVHILTLLSKGGGERDAVELADHAATAARISGHLARVWFWVISYPLNATGGVERLRRHALEKLKRES